MVGPMKQTFVGLLVFLVLQASVPARADSSRCHAAEKNCPAGQDPYCWCPSKTASDYECRWRCGSIER